jgi:hypothetical protein
VKVRTARTRQRRKPREPSHRKHRKYTREPDLLSEQDREKLAQSLTRLVSKYGRQFLSATIRHVDPHTNSPREESISAPVKREKRSVGRPYMGQPWRDRVWLASVLNDWAEENRQDGSRKPMFDAEYTLYEFSFDEKQRRQPGHFERWRKQIKKKRLRGKRELREWLDYLDAAKRRAPIIVSQILN